MPYHSSATSKKVSMVNGKVANIVDELDDKVNELEKKRLLNGTKCLMQKLTKV
jgi:hypothetical protein